MTSKRRHPRGSTTLAAAWLLAATTAAAAGTAPSSDVSSALDLQIQKAELDNGLRVVMNVDRTAPNVAVSVTYDVGARNEIPGRSGFAHLFEHMMFQGSRNVRKGEHFTLITARGGNLNGTTSSDRTN
jgi:predicted Zn-dependent peptidase